MSGGFSGIFGELLSTSLSNASQASPASAKLLNGERAVAMMRESPNVRESPDQWDSQRLLRKKSQRCSLATAYG
jgi:hypothetical protein